MRNQNINNINKIKELENKINPHNIYINNNKNEANKIKIDSIDLNKKFSSPEKILKLKLSKKMKYNLKWLNLTNK